MFEIGKDKKVGLYKELRTKLNDIYIKITLSDLTQMSFA